MYLILEMDILNDGKILKKSRVEPYLSHTSKEFIKCRIHHFLIMEWCRCLVFQLNNYIKHLKTVPAFSFIIYFYNYLDLGGILLST